MADPYEGMLKSSKFLQEMVVESKKRVDTNPLLFTVDAVEENMWTTVGEVAKTYRVSNEYVMGMVERMEEVLVENGNGNWYDRWVVGEDNSSLWNETVKSLMSDEEFLRMTRPLDERSRSMLMAPMSWILTAQKFVLEQRMNSNEELIAGEHGELGGERLWSIEYKGVNIEMVMGDILGVDAEAVVCPTDPWFELGGGEVEARIDEASGGEIFGKKNKVVLKLMERMLKNKGSADAMVASEELADYVTRGGGSLDPTVMMEGVSSFVKMVDLGGPKEHIELFYGAALPVPAGRRLEGLGIDTVVLVNVTPRGGMKKGDMEMFVSNSVGAAAMAGAESIAIPAIGTGNARSNGFGLSMMDSVGGFLNGAKKYIDGQGGSSVRRIKYVVYNRPDDRLVKQLPDSWQLICQNQPQLESGG
jgi:O-acetyl-ADP-ribose deacetylase (regulator of RNase III)